MSIIFIEHWLIIYDSEILHSSDVLHAVSNLVNLKAFSSKHMSIFWQRKYVVISQLRQTYAKDPFSRDLAHLVLFVSYTTTTNVFQQFNFLHVLGLQQRSQYSEIEIFLYDCTTLSNYLRPDDNFQRPNEWQSWTLEKRKKFNCDILLLYWFKNSTIYWFEEQKCVVFKNDIISFSNRFWILEATQSKTSPMPWSWNLDFVSILLYLK